MGYCHHAEIDSNPRQVLDLYLIDTKCAGHYAYLLSHTDYNKTLEDFDIFLLTLYFQILEWLDPVKTLLESGSYTDAKKECIEYTEKVALMVRSLNFLNYDQDIVNIDYIVMAYTQSIIAGLCQKHGRYKLGMDMYSEWLMLDSFIKTTHGFSYAEIVSQIPKNPKQVAANRYKKVLIPLAKIIWARHDISCLISPATMADILMILLSNHTEKTPSKRAIKSWLKQHKSIIPESVITRLSKDSSYTLDDKEKEQLEIQKLFILEKYKNTCNQV